MEHVIHINDGSDNATPLVLSLLAGEEAAIDLKVVNHGEPSNLSLRASGSISRAVRLRRSSYQVAQEEVITIIARMPDGPERMDGDLIFLGGGREIRLPITLLCDSEEKESSSWDLAKPGSEADEEEEVDDWVDEEPYEAEQDEEDKSSYSRSREHQEDEAGREPRKISFSRDRDLQIYRSAAGRRRSTEDTRTVPDETMESRGVEGYEGRRATHGNQMDDRFVDKRSRQDEPGHLQSELGSQESEEEEGGSAAASVGEGGEEAALDFRQDADTESREIIHQAEREEIISQVREEALRQEKYSRDQNDDDDHEMRSSKLQLLGRFIGLADVTMQKAVPAAIFLILVLVLILTFVTESLPEFPGALGSSILIVTLIIYGAATLLKA